MVGVAGIFLLTGSAQSPRLDATAAPMAAPAPMSPATTVEATAQADLFGDLLAKARQAYAGAADYTCTFVKQELVNGQLGPAQTCQMKARTQPFAVHMKFTSPESVSGQEACYTASMGGKFRARAPGWKGKIGFVTIDLTDPRAMKDNRHTTAEAGLGNLIETLGRSHEIEAKQGPMKLIVAEYKVVDRVCTRVEITHTMPDTLAYCHRAVVYFDKETNLPIRFEAYDRPADGGPAGGALIECYNYLDLRLNVGLTDAAFKY
jgi:hypothetical protein